MELSYFDISLYVVYTIAAIVVPTFLWRLSRTFPAYVKTGSMGNDDNLLILRTKDAYWKTRVYDFFNETHPVTVIIDGVVIGGMSVVLFMGWGLVPPTILGTLIVVGVIKSAKHMRSQHIKKQEFHTKLKGD